MVLAVSTPTPGPSSTEPVPPILAENRPARANISSLHDTIVKAEFEYAAYPLTDAITFNDDQLSVGASRCHVTDAGMHRLCRQIGAPAAYLCKLSATIRSELIRYHLAKSEHVPSGQSSDDMAVISRKGHFVAFARTDLTEFRGADVLGAICDGIGQAADDIVVNRVDIAADSFEFDLISRAIVEEISAGDIIQAGLRVTYSPIAEFATRIESYVLRLVCMNGMTHRQCVNTTSITRTRRLSANHPNAKTLQYDQLRRLAADTWRGLTLQLAAVKSLASERVAVPDLLTRFLRRARLFSQKTMRYLQDAWESEGAEETAYAVLNAMTNVATHRAELSTAQRRSLSSLAGVLAHRSTHICPRCFSVIPRN